MRKTNVPFDNTNKKLVILGVVMVLFLIGMSKGKTAIEGFANQQANRLGEYLQAQIQETLPSK